MIVYANFMLIYVKIIKKFKKTKNVFLSDTRSTQKYSSEPHKKKIFSIENVEFYVL